MAEKKPFLLRLPPDLWDDLQRWAADDLRSVNGQMEYLLRRAVEDRRRRAGGEEGEGHHEDTKAQREKP